MQLFTLKEIGIYENLVYDQDGNSLSSDITAFEPIGYNQPLCIRFHTFYAGNLRNFLNAKKDILITSLIKDDITPAAAPHAIHQIYEGKKDQDIMFVEAGNQGTELIYYSDSLDVNKLNLSIEVYASPHNKEMTDEVGNSLVNAGGLPVFIAQAPILMTLGQIVKTGKSLYDKIIDKKGALMKYPLDIVDETAGFKNTEPGFYIGANPEDRSKIKDLRIFSPDGLHNKYVLGKKKPSGKGIDEYKGEIPYVIISIDGKKHENYKDFKRFHATSKLLKRFIDQPEKTDLKEVSTMLSLFNDYSLIQRIKKENDLIHNYKDGQKREESESKIEAFKANIQNPDLFGHFLEQLTTKQK